MSKHDLGSIFGVTDRTVISKKKIYKVSIHSFCMLRFPSILAGWWNIHIGEPVYLFLEMTVMHC